MWASFKGVGKVWQLTACDCASSFGWARLLIGEVTAGAMASFLRRVVRPGCQRAGWPLQRVLTDRGKEFKGAFTETCAQVGLDAHADEAPSCLDQWIRRTAARHHPA